MRVVIVIPTYNERDNIEKLIPVLQEVFDTRPETDFQILVVDGNSPDGTAVVVQDFAEQYANTHLLLEKSKRGLGAAYIYGFKHAMNDMKADVIIEMDADFQHDPWDIPKMVEAIESGADYVIGSRFIKGGSIPESWSFNRKFWSWGGNIFSKIVLGIFNVNDFTSGFKASRVRGFVDRLDLDAILSQGFAYKIDLLHKMHRLGARVQEIPIVFGLRDRGDSKMESNNTFDSLRVVLTLRLREIERFLKFAVVGVIGFIVDTGLFNLLLWQSNISENHSSGLSGFIAMNVTFALNNFWSFGAQKITNLPSILKKIPIYYLISYIPILFRSEVLIPLTLKYLGNSVLIVNTAFLVGVGLGLIWNFTFYSKIVWRKRSHD